MTDQDGVGVREDEVAARTEERPEREGKEAPDVGAGKRREREIQETEGEKPSCKESGDEPAGKACNTVAEDDRDDLDGYPDNVGAAC